MRIPRWARSLWHPGSSSLKREKKVSRPRKRERELHNQRRGLLSKSQAVRLAKEQPRKTQSSARR